MGIGAITTVTKRLFSNIDRKVFRDTLKVSFRSIALALTGVLDTTSFTFSNVCTQLYSPLGDISQKDTEFSCLLGKQTLA